MNDWNLILVVARDTFNKDISWRSLGEQVWYKFRSIEDDKIVIRRLNGGEDAAITKTAAIDAIKKLKNKKRLQRTELIRNVVRQSTLTYLHPFIYWDTKSKEIVWEDLANSVHETYNLIFNAKDDELSKISRWVNQRLNQTVFRNNMMLLYDGKCAITKTPVETVLEAAHIVAHSIRGDNSNANGILLRSDIHKLFDNGLIGIEPDSLLIIIDPTLIGTEYEKYAGRKISDRVDGSQIGRDFLYERFKLYAP